MGAWSSWSRREFVFARFPSGRINRRTRIERKPRLPEGDAISDPEVERGVCHQQTSFRQKSLNRVGDSSV
jgi:hypothetical protein